MEKLKEKIVRVKEWAATPRAKKRIYVGLVVLLIGWVVFRFAVIGVQNRLQVYNPARAAKTDGIPVSVIEMSRTPGIILEPMTVKNNRAYVSGARAGLLRAGMKVGDGEIVSVASGIDLDTGMHVVRTHGVADGLQLAEFKATGYFIPVHALDNGAVFVVRDGAAHRVPVKVGRQDKDNAYITAGLADGDMVIVSRVADGDKVNVKK
ncbi:MAG: hypothetical protein K2I81_04960 [Alphaproteobacteria bacterium]|nr:hypothetical protein [Alphaproteobacteria bacterium]